MGGNQNICTFAKDKLIYKRCNDVCKCDKWILRLQTSHKTYANVIRLHMSGNIDTRKTTHEKDAAEMIKHCKLAKESEALQPIV